MEIEPDNDRIFENKTINHFQGRYSFLDSRKSLPRFIREMMTENQTVTDIHKNTMEDDEANIESARGLMHARSALTLDPKPFYTQLPPSKEATQGKLRPSLTKALPKSGSIITDLSVGTQGRQDTEQNTLDK